MLSTDNSRIRQHRQVWTSLGIEENMTFTQCVVYPADRTQSPKPQCQWSSKCTAFCKITKMPKVKIGFGQSNKMVEVPFST